MSEYLIDVLRKYPLLYYAVEEAMLCAKMGYYCAGILTFSQLLKQFHKKTPASRHDVAHKIFKVRPTKNTFESILEEFKKAASDRSKHECAKCSNIEEYQQKISASWKRLMEEFHTAQ